LLLSLPLLLPLFLFLPLSLPLLFFLSFPKDTHSEGNANLRGLRSASGIENSRFINSLAQGPVC